MKIAWTFFKSYKIFNYLYLIITLLQQGIVVIVIVLSERLTANSQLLDKNLFMYKLHAELFCVWFYTTRVTDKITICLMVIWSDLWSVIKIFDDDGVIIVYGRGLQHVAESNSEPPKKLWLPHSKMEHNGTWER